MNRKNISVISIVLNKYKNYSTELVEVTAKEAAIILKVSARTLEAWRAKRKYLRFNKLPGGITYNLRDVLDYKNTLDI